MIIIKRMSNVIFDFYTSTLSIPLVGSSRSSSSSSSSSRQ